MLDKRDIYKESCSGRDKDSGHIKNAKIQVITKKLWYIEVSQRNRHDAAWPKKSEFTAKYILALAI